MATVRLQIRRGTASQWTSANPTLAAGEMGVETDTRKVKIGDGTTSWTSLNYIAADNPEISEIAQDAIDAALVAGTGIVKSYNDGANTITVSVDTSVIATKAELAEVAQDSIDQALTAGTGITKNYDDAANTLTVSVDTGVIATKASPTFTGTVTLPSVNAGGNIIPSVDNTYDLGSPDKMWRDVYVGPGSIYVNGQKVLETDNGDVVVTADVDENLSLRTTGSGNLELNAQGSGNIQIKSAMSIAAGENITSSDGNPIHFASPISTDSITSHSANTDLTITGSGTGKVYLNDNAEVSGNLTVGGNLTVSGSVTSINTETLSVADNIIDLNSNFISGTPTENAGIKVKRGDEADVQFRWNETSNAWEFTNDGASYTEVSSIDYVDDEIANLSSNLNSTITSDYIPFSEKGAALGVATLDADTLVPLSELTHATDYTDTHNSTTTDVHGISDTLILVTTTGSQALTNKTLTSAVVQNGIEINGGVIFEGATDNDYETTLYATDPTSDHTIYLPDNSGTVALTSNLNSYAALSGAAFTGAVSGTDLTLSGNLTVNGSTTNINTVDLNVEDKNITLGDTSSPSDASASGGGISLKGSTDKSLTWDITTTSWTSSENFDLLDGKTYKIDGNIVLSSSEVLGKSVPSGTIVGSSDSQTLTNKTIDLTDNTLSGTLAEFNAALSDADFVTLAGEETLTNKTLTSPVINAPTGISKSDVGLANVDNISDLNKPVSTATQTALDLKSDKASPTFTGTVVLPSTTSIGNVSSTEIEALDGINSNIQTQIDSKSPSASPTFTGTVVLPSTTSIGNVSSTEIESLDGVTSSIQTQLNARLESATAASTYAPIASPTFTGTVSGITKSMVGLSNVDNTSDTNKPVSTATQTALDLKANLASPTFTGTVVLPSATSVGNVSSTEIGYLNNVTSAIQTQLDAKLSSASAASTYAPLASPALTGTPTAPTATAGTNTTQVATTAFVTGAVSDLVASAPGALDTLNELAAALGDDANFSTTVTNSLAEKAPIASPTFTGTVTVAASGIAFTDGTQTKQGVPSQTTINSISASYNLSTGGLALRDTMVESSASSGITVTIPTNATTAYPVGTTIDFLQTGTGQITFAGASGVTVNGTPGLKTRAQWSSVSLFKRSTDAWVVLGDLTA